MWNTHLIFTFIFDTVFLYYFSKLFVIRRRKRKKHNDNRKLLPSLPEDGIAIGDWNYVESVFSATQSEVIAHNIFVM